MTTSGREEETSRSRACAQPDPRRDGVRSIRPASRGASGCVAILPLTHRSSPGGRSSAVTSTLAHGAGSRSLGEPGPSRSAGCESRPRHPAARGSRTATNYRIRPVPGRRLRHRPRLVYVLGADARRRTDPAAFYANAGFSDYPPGYLYLLWPIGAGRAAHRRPGRGRERPHQAAADPHRHGRRLRPLPARAGLGVAGPAGRDPRARGGCAVRVQPGLLLRLRALGPDGCRRCARAAARRRGAHPRQQRGRDGDGGDGRARQAAVRRRPRPARRGRAAEAPPRCGRARVRGIARGPRRRSRDGSTAIGARSAS